MQILFYNLDVSAIASGFYEIRRCIISYVYI